MTAETPQPTQRVTAERLHNALVSADWQLGGGRERVYERWLAPEAGPDGELILPLDPNRPDFESLLSEAWMRVVALSRSSTRASRALSFISRAPGDEILFRKDALTISGAVAWPLGEELIVSARHALIAAAKARLARRAYFGQKSGAFAKRYLNSVLMGQTQIGSYVVSAYAPVDEVFLESAERPKPAGQIKGPSSLVAAGAGWTGREITQTLTSALEGLTDATQHYAQSSSLSGFDAAVQKGVSRELADAVTQMISGSREATIDVTFTESAQLVLRVSNELIPPSRQGFTFEGTLRPVLERASNHLRTLSPDEYVTATGWVSVVSRPSRSEAGVVRLKVLRGSNARTISVRLSENQWHLAAAAIASDLVLLTVIGRQVKEGNRHWIYDVSEVRVLEEPRTPRPLPARSITEALDLFGRGAEDRPSI
jgi:hypothetical protein